VAAAHAGQAEGAQGLEAGPTGEESSELQQRASDAQAQARLSTGLAPALQGGNSGRRDGLSGSNACT
jgi:hypothetical protein